MCISRLSRRFHPYRVSSADTLPCGGKKVKRRSRGAVPRAQGRMMIRRNPRDARKKLSFQEMDKNRAVCYTISTGCAPDFPNGGEEHEAVSRRKYEKTQTGKGPDAGSARRGARCLPADHQPLGGRIELSRRSCIGSRWIQRRKTGRRTRCSSSSTT